MEPMGNDPLEQDCSFASWDVHLRTASGCFGSGCGLQWPGPGIVASLYRVYTQIFQHPLSTWDIP